MADGTRDWALTSQTNSTQTDLADLVDFGKVQMYYDTDTGTVQAKEGLYGNTAISDLDIASIDSMEMTWDARKALPGGTSTFRCRKNGTSTWNDTEVVYGSDYTTHSFTFSDSFDVKSYFNFDLSLVCSLSAGNTYFKNIHIIFTYTLNRYTVSVESGTGGSVSGGGSNLLKGDTVTIKAAASSGYYFVQWNDGNTSTERTITVSGNETYTATFAKYLTLTVSADPSEGGKITNTSGKTYSGGSKFKSGDTATFTATANDGYYFTGWNDGDTNATRTVTITEDGTNYIAYFEYDPVEFISAAIEPEGKVLEGAGLTIKAEVC